MTARTRCRQPSAAASACWRASPLTYVGARSSPALLSIFPFYYMFVIATRSQRRDQRPAAAVHRRAATFGDNFGRVLDNDDANFFNGLINSLIVSSVVTAVAWCSSSTLAGFAFAKLKFRGSNALLLIDPRHDDGADPARPHPAVGHDGRARLVRHPATRSSCRSSSARSACS